jgi:hypothetical protein
VLFRDRDLVALQAEYRLPLSRRFEAVGFADAGAVASEVLELGPGDLEPSLDGGLRYRLSRKENMKARLGVGVGEEGAEVYVTLFEAQ